jgi:PAS domain S-box-containing protein
MDKIKDGCERAVRGEHIRFNVQVRRPGDVLMWSDMRLSALKDENGHPTHLVCSGIDLTAHKETEAKLRASEKKFRDIFENAFVGVAIVGLDGRWLDVNETLCKLLGYTQAEMRQMTFQDITHAEDVERNKAEVVNLLNRGADSYRTDKRYVRKNGEVLWCNLTVSLQRDVAGAPLHFVSIVNDISERVQAQERLQLLMSELGHRLKNQLAVVEAIGNQSARNAVSIDAFRSIFAGRIHALAASVDLIVRNSQNAVSLRELVARQLSAFVGELSADGPGVTLPGEAAETLGLALHELATNCTKYGAWSQAAGRVNVKWRLSDEQGRLILIWQEEGGPLVQPPQRKGFGRTVIEMVAAQKLKANVKLDYKPEGLEWRLDMPLE